MAQRVKRPSATEVRRRLVEQAMKDLLPLVDRYDAVNRTNGRSILYAALLRMREADRKRERLAELKKQVVELEKEVGT